MRFKFFALSIHFSVCSTLDWEYSIYLDWRSPRSLCMGRHGRHTCTRIWSVDLIPCRRLQISLGKFKYAHTVNCHVVRKLTLYLLKFTLCKLYNHYVHMHKGGLEYRLVIDIRKKEIDCSVQPKFIIRSRHLVVTTSLTLSTIKSYLKLRYRSWCKV